MAETGVKKRTSFKNMEIDSGTVAFGLFALLVVLLALLVVFFGVAVICKWRLGFTLVTRVLVGASALLALVWLWRTGPWGIIGVGIFGLFALLLRWMFQLLGPSLAAFGQILWFVVTSDQFLWIVAGLLILYAWGPVAALLWCVLGVLLLILHTLAKRLRNPGQS